MGSSVQMLSDGGKNRTIFLVQKQGKEWYNYKVIKKFVVSHQKFISGVLLMLVIVGSLAALVAIASPFLLLGTLKFIDGKPDAPNLIDDIVKLILSPFNFVPAALFLGSISAFLYTFLDPDNKIFLRIWSVALFIIFVIFTYQYFR